MDLARQETGSGPTGGLRRRADEDAERRERQASAAAQLTEAALGGADPTQLMMRAVTAMRSELGVSRASVLQLTADGESPALATGAGWHERLLGKPLEGVAVTGDARPLLGGLTRFGIRSSVTAWISYAGRHVAVLAAHSDASRVFSEEERRFVESSADVLAHSFARAEVEQTLRDEALHDPLTGLANRALFLERLEHWLARHARLPERAAVIFLDLDGFKAINDTRGHAVGDEILRVVAERLLRTVRAGTTVARLGGDEFAILVEALDANWGARTVAVRLEQAFKEPFPVTGDSFTLTASIGIATPSARSRSEEVVRQADAAMYAAKRDGGARVRIFDRGMHEDAHRRLRLERQLRDAVRQDDFEILYQPMVRLRDGQLAGFEALLRWRRDGRLLPPAAFLTVAEETSLIVQMGGRVLDVVCAQAAAWQDRGPTRVSVNLSPRQVGSIILVEQVTAALARSGLKPDRLCLEIDETAFVEQPESSRETLKVLHGLGVKLALDGFGLRYGALSTLEHAGVDLIKIDRSCVQDIDRRPERRALVAAIASTAAALNIGVVAEGIERAGVRDVARTVGCRFAQGHHFARPLDVTQATAALRARSLWGLSPMPRVLDGTAQ